jgi:hypothetical protein
MIAATTSRIARNGRDVWPRRNATTMKANAVNPARNKITMPLIGLAADLHFNLPERQAFQQNVNHGSN